ncbi:MAG: hypothetical protein ABIF40_02350 [archaeon]
MNNPHQNLFYYYRGPSKKKKQKIYDIQLEDNTTKALINVLELCFKSGSPGITLKFLKNNKIRNCRKVLGYQLQIRKEKSQPDASIVCKNKTVYIESKLASPLKRKQIKNHLGSLKIEDNLLIITDKEKDKRILDDIKDKRLKFTTWDRIHRFFQNINKSNKELLKLLVKDFTNYLEVNALTQFNGFKDEDFNYFIEPYERYTPILKNKLEKLSDLSFSRLNKNIRKKYSKIKTGNISKSYDELKCAWVAIKKSEKKKDVFKHCNFSLELNRDNFCVNLVIRDGRSDDKRMPIGKFCKKVENNKKEFLKLVKNIQNTCTFQIYERKAKAKTKKGVDIFQSGENWNPVISLKLQKINLDSIDFLLKFIKRIKYPGLIISQEIPRGNPILLNKVKLLKLIKQRIEEYYPILEFIESKS